jgi:hypothetical protein
MGEAKRRGTREERAAQAVERDRLERIEQERLRVEAHRARHERLKAKKFAEIKERIETRHLKIKIKPRHPESFRQRRRHAGLMLPMMLAACVIT